tara:strand:+ start:2422 stop:3426 length:1005 start_codon:yes stop_codon:yes gene_type:complete
MGFLDNSGDIILDAVLTDTGRFRLARGDGTFKIAKFALGDDEIDYGLYDKNHANGSSYFDVNLLRTPVLEAFTNNTSFLKNKLVTISRTNLLYMPTLLINSKATSPKVGAGNNSKQFSTTSLFLVAVNKDTVEDTNFKVSGKVQTSNALTDGILNGTAGATSIGGGFIRLDQGLDTTEVPPSKTLDPDLLETQYLIEMDDRLGRPVTTKNTGISFNFRDDDFIASYYVAQGGNKGMVFPNGNKLPTTDSSAGFEVIRGPRGSTLEFKIQASDDLRNSDYLFTTLGNQDTSNAMGFGTDANSNNIFYIDSTVRVTGLTTGYRLDVPIRFIKKKTV